MCEKMPEVNKGRSRHWKILEGNCLCRVTKCYHIGILKNWEVLQTLLLSNITSVLTTILTGSEN